MFSFCKCENKFMKAEEGEKVDEIIKIVSTYS